MGLAGKGSVLNDLQDLHGQVVISSDRTGVYRYDLHISDVVFMLETNTSFR